LLIDSQPKKQCDGSDSDIWLISADLQCRQLDELKQPIRMEHESVWPVWSSTQALVKACKLNEAGLVETANEMTCLGAQAWLVAVQIYALCRFKRYAGGFFHKKKGRKRCRLTIRLMKFDANRVIPDLASTSVTQCSREELQLLRRLAQA
jgi:hypothetical protein